MEFSHLELKVDVNGMGPTCSRGVFYEKLSGSPGVWVGET